MDYDYFHERVPNVAAEHQRRVRHQVQLRRHLRDTTDPFAISVTEFINLYRMPQHLLLDFVEIIRPYFIERRATSYVPVELKVLSSVGFYAVGSYQRPHGRSADINISQSMVSRSLHEVTQALNHPDILTRFIRFPTAHEEREAVINRNCVLGMPRTLGFIDGTLVKIVPPAEEKHVYYCRKGYTALNVQIVCDAKLYIMDVNSQFPGSANDPHIYRMSPVRNAVMNAFHEDRCWLLGDSAYPHEPWLQLPLPHAEPGTPEFSYTKLHCHCRHSVERCIGVLKARWRCLLCDRTLHYKPDKAGQIVNACVVLHNYLNVSNSQLPEPVLENLGNDDPEENLEEDFHILQAANKVRRYLIRVAHERWQILHQHD